MNLTPPSSWDAIPRTGLSAMGLASLAEISTSLAVLRCCALIAPTQPAGRRALRQISSHRMAHSIDDRAKVYRNVVTIGAQLGLFNVGAGSEGDQKKRWHGRPAIFLTAYCLTLITGISRPPCCRINSTVFASSPVTKLISEPRPVAKKRVVDSG